MRDVFVMVIYFKNNFLKGDMGSTDIWTLQKYSFFLKLPKISMKKLTFLFVLRLCLAKVRINFQLLIANAQFLVLPKRTGNAF